MKTGELLPPTDECVACGAEDSYARALTRTQKDFRGESFAVKHHHWKCSACGVAVLGDVEMDEVMRATVAAYQHAHGWHDVRMFLKQPEATKADDS
jgi:hypothetical protein